MYIASYIIMKIMRKEFLKATRVTVGDWETKNSNEVKNQKN